MTVALSSSGRERRDLVRSVEAIMKVGEAMTRRIQFIESETTLLNAARKMRDANIGALPVCENDRLVGLITDRDLVVRGMAEAKDPSVSVREVMSQKVEWCFEEDELIDAARKMQEAGVRRLVVLDHAKRAVGLLSIDDIAAQDDEDILTRELLDSVSSAPTL